MHDLAAMISVLLKAELDRVRPECMWRGQLGRRPASETNKRGPS